MMEYEYLCGNKVSMKVSFFVENIDVVTMLNCSDTIRSIMDQGVLV